MLQLPAPTRISRNFLDGNGNFEFTTDNDVWRTLVEGNQPFLKETDTVAEVVLGGGATRDFAFGRRDDFNLKVQLGAQLLHQAQILWPDRDDELARQYGIRIGQNKLCARVVMHAKADGAAKAGFPVGPLSATVGVAAGGTVAYERWITRDAGLTARSILRDLYEGIRLPQHVDDPAEIPAAGELLITRLGGYLRLNAGLSWGYSVTGTRDIEANRLELNLDYRLRAMAAVTFGYGLAGEFQIEARPGSEANWCRFVVRKSRESQSAIAADFAVEGKIEPKGLPEAADDFLSKLIGTHADRVLELFHASRRYASIEELEKAAGKLLAGAVRKYSQEALGIVLSNDTVQQFLESMQKVAETYRNLDSRIVDLYHSVLEERKKGIAATRTALDLILAAGTRGRLLELAGSGGFSGAVDLLRRVAGDGVFDVLRKDGAFAEVLRLLGHARKFIEGEADGEVRKWIDLLKREIPLEELLTDLGKAGTEEGIRALADERLKALVESLTGKAFDRLTKSDIGELVGILANNLERIENFKQRWYVRLREEIAQSFRAKLNLAYTRTHRNEKLLDLEINLADENGRRMARAATRGDFREVLDSYDTRIVRLRHSMFQDKVQSTSEIRMNLLGWGSEGMVTLVREIDHAIEPQGSGLLHIYTSRNYVERKKMSGWRFKEEVYSRFLVNAVAEQSQAGGERFTPLGASMLRSLTGDYRLMAKDAKTSVGELSEHLQFARSLGLLDMDAASYARQFAEDCGGDLGAVSIDYRVQFSQQDLLSAFHLDAGGDLDGGTLGKLARRAMREFILHKYGALPPTDWLARVGFAYCSDEAYGWHRSATLKSKLKGVVLPAWFTGEKKPVEVSIPAHMAALVETLFRHEDTLIEALVKIDPLMDRVRNNQKVEFREFNAAIVELVKSARSLGAYDASCFPAILDRLIEFSTAGAACRDTVMILEARPQRGPLAGQTVTRVLAAPLKTVLTVAEDEAVPAQEDVAAA